MGLPPEDLPQIVPFLCREIKRPFFDCLAGRQTKPFEVDASESETTRGEAGNRALIGMR